MTGRVSVDRKVEIFSGGRVEGELYAAAPAVHISEGGVLEGELHMTQGEEETTKERGGPTEPGAPQA
ncbi:MAG: hypothetical protein ACE5ID_07500 [Acidobacteriota bacterium]